MTLPVYVHNVSFDNVHNLALPGRQHGEGFGKCLSVQMPDRSRFHTGLCFASEACAGAAAQLCAEKAGSLSTWGRTEGHPQNQNDHFQDAEAPEEASETERPGDAGQCAASGTWRRLVSAKKNQNAYPAGGTVGISGKT